MREIKRKKGFKFVREFNIGPAWDKRNPDPKKNYGIHGCELRFILKGDEGAISFVLFTDWDPLHVQNEAMGRGTTSTVTREVVGTQPMGASIDYHSPKPLAEWQDDSSWHSKRTDCPYTKDGICYSDGSGLRAEEVRNRMLLEGLDGIWKEMERYYYETFFDPDNREPGFGDMMAAITGILTDDEKDS